MSVRDDLVAWMRRELPHVKVPSEDTLAALTEGQHQKDLWQKVTKRVRTEEHAKEIRAFLALTAENERFVPSSDEQNELQQLLDETRRVEKDISLLREQLEEVDEKEEGDITAAEIDEAVMEGVLHIVTDQEEELTQLLGLLQRSPWGEGGDSSASESDDESRDTGNSVETAVRNWCQKGESEWNMAESELQMALSEGWGARVGTALLLLLRESEASLANTVSAQGSTTVRSGAEELVRDAQLRAFSRLRTLEREHRAAEQRAKAMKQGVENSRALWAQIEAERAALAFASKPRQMNSGAAAERRAKRAVRRGKDVVKELEGCAKELCVGSLTVLKTASRDIADVTSSSKRLERDLASAADAAENMLKHMEQELHRDNRENDPRQTFIPVRTLATDVETHGIQKVRRMELQRWHDKSARIFTGLSARSEVLCEQRAHAIRELESVWLPRLRHAVQEGDRWREEDVAKVTQSLSEMSKQPGLGAAAWLFSA
eukprot:TRINITY_DN905_c0_g1_i1.p1 TRINITY_DN905_c0_g1~~TRINITY_DN905_c0_g1_i1.p1  ORF type:complete len:490 (+),score=94.94 TRINITY_DN905_c0_g1_i1:142-1611(+)